MKINIYARWYLAGFINGIFMGIVIYGILTK